MWKGGAANQQSFLDSVGPGMGVVYRLDPELASQIEGFIQSGEDVLGLVQSFTSGDSAAKGAALMEVVKVVINLYTMAIERLAQKSKAERDRKLSEARFEFFERALSTAPGWVYDVTTVPHISISVSGTGLWTPGGDYKPAIYKPELKSSTKYRYLRPGPSRNPRGCAAEVPNIGSVEGTNSKSCKGQIAVYPLLYPCWRERSLSTGGEFIRSSDRDNPGALMLDLQVRAVLEPVTNLNIPLTRLETVVSGFEDRFWGAVNKRKSPRRDSAGWVNGKLASRSGNLNNYPAKAGLCGRLNQSGATEQGEWITGLQVLSKKPEDPSLNERFWMDDDGIIRAVWTDADLDTCYVLSWGGNASYDPDTGDMGRCTVAARNSIWAQWLNISTARQFWGTRDYIREQWKNGDFSVDASALSVLEGGGISVKKLTPKRMRKMKTAKDVTSLSPEGGGAGVAAAAVVGLGGLLLFLRR